MQDLEFPDGFNTGRGLYRLYAEGRALAARLEIAVSMVSVMWPALAVAAATTSPSAADPRRRNLVRDMGISSFVLVWGNTLATDDPNESSAVFFSIRSAGRGRSYTCPAPREAVDNIVQD